MEDHGTQEAGTPHPLRALGQEAGEQPARAPGPEPVREVPDEAPPAPTPPGRRVRGALLLAAAVAVVTGVLIWWLHARGYEETDDAAIDGDIVSVSSRVPGTVTAVHVIDNQVVKAGEVLVELDPTDLEVAVAQAKAAVAQAEAQVASDQPNVSITRSSGRSAVRQAQADTEAAQSQLEADQRGLDEAMANERLAASQLERARQLVAGGAMSRADFDQRSTAHDVAVAAVATAQKQLQAQEARLRGALSREHEVEQNAPRELESREASVDARRADLELAEARLHQAQLDLGYAKLAAPAAGIVGRLSVHAGERVEVGQQLMALTRADRLWVTANFRETQIRRMRPGQHVEVHVDALGRDFTGEVESFGGATGSRYSLLPPENASGNYVKVVQRIPVRITLDPGQPGLDRLRPGMSVEPSVALR